ncbi:hypothetical protein BH10BDE1_BH10BDE1_04020 [soil metagenome]
MNPWLIYIKERFPIPVYLLISSGLALSGAAMVERDFVSVSTVLCFAYAMWVFATLRLMDEFKDYDKDVIAHPTRPLPRGILRKDSVGRVIIHMMNIGWAFTVVFYFVSLEASILSTITTAWLWLMYKEFYSGPALSKRPLIYAVTHQIILVPFCLLMALKIDDFTIGWSLAVLGSFFTYEVSRKLDPKAHPILGTYLNVYGRQGSFVIVALLFAVSAIGAKSIGYQLWMSPWAILTLAMYGLLWLKPSAFKLIEGAATLSLFFHIWAPAINSLIAKFAASGVKP